MWSQREAEPWLVPPNLRNQVKKDGPARWLQAAPPLHFAVHQSLMKPAPVGMTFEKRSGSYSTAFYQPRKWFVASNDSGDGETSGGPHFNADEYVKANKRHSHPQGPKDASRGLRKGLSPVVPDPDSNASSIIDVKEDTRTLRSESMSPTPALVKEPLIEDCDRGKLHTEITISPRRGSSAPPTEDGSARDRVPPDTSEPDDQPRWKRFLDRLFCLRRRRRERMASNFDDEEDDMLFLPPHLREKAKEISNADAMKWLQASTSMAPKHASLSNKLQRHLEKQEKKRKRASLTSRPSLCSLASVDEGGESDAYSASEGRRSQSEIPEDLLEMARSTSPRSTNPEAASSDVDSAMANGIVIRKKTFTLGAMTSSAVTEPSDAATRRVNFAQTSQQMPTIEDNEVEEEIQIPEYDNTLYRRDSLMGRGYDPNMVDWAAPPPQLNLDESDCEDPQGDDDWFDCPDAGTEQDVDGTNGMDRAFVESMQGMSLSCDVVDGVFEDDEKTPPVRRPSLTRVVEEAPESRGMLGDRRHVVNGNLGPMVHTKRSSSVSPRDNNYGTLPSSAISTNDVQRGRIQAINKQNGHSAPPSQMTMSAHPSLSSTPSDRPNRSQMGRTQPMSARLASEPPVNVQMTNGTMSARGPAMRATTVSPGISQTALSSRADLNELQELARRQEAALRQEVMASIRQSSCEAEMRQNGQRKGSAGGPNSRVTPAMVLPSSKSTDIAALQRPQRAASVSRLPAPKATVPSSLKRTGILAPGFGANRLTNGLGALSGSKIRSPSVQPQRYRATVVDDECF